MALAPGTKIGPYEIVGPLGAGGMGEVYRARDARLARDVAVKVLSSELLRDPDRQRRFEQEARAAGQLNHPHIVAVYDAGTHEGIPYLVEELLEGETLRQRLAGSRLPARKALEYGRQMVQGLAAAHQKGIVHRDLKPENLFLTSDGIVKILDFGLAKLTRRDTSDVAPTQAPTQAETGAGVVLGTVGYMSPEQVRGQPADNRSDIFSFGAILYEMLTGHRPFEAPSSVETMNAILHAEPEPLSRAGEPMPSGLERLVQHCMEKRPEERFQSARDLAFQIEALSSVSTTAVSGVPHAARRRRVSLLGAAGAGLAALLALAIGFLAGRGMPVSSSAAIYRQLTFQQGNITSARFTPDGQSVVYSAAWEGRPTDLYTTRPGSPESRSLSMPGSDVLSISRDGEMALLQEGRYTLGFMRLGTLARAPLSGGAPRPVLENVQDADWGPDGRSLAVAHAVESRYRLEYPIGTVLYETGSWISSLRVSPDGERIAFIDHPLAGDNRGRIGVATRSGEVSFLTEPFSSAEGVAWHPAGKEIWFTAGLTGNVQALYAVDLKSRRRVVDGAPTSFVLQDVSPEGRVLLTRDIVRRGIIGRGPREPAERDLSWLDWSRPGALSSDGEWLLFDEQGQGGGPAYSVYMRGTDGSVPLRLGEGTVLAMSPDGRWAITLPVDDQEKLVLFPTGTGQPRALSFPGFILVGAAILPDHRSVLLRARTGTASPRLYLTDLEAATPRPVTEEGIGFGHALSPDGREVAATGRDGLPTIYALESGVSRPVRGGLAGDVITQWSQDGSHLYVTTRKGGVVRVDQLALDSGERRMWKELKPADPSGVIDIDFIRVTPDARAYIYSYRRRLAALFLVEGLS